MEDLMAASTMREYFAEAIEQGLAQGLERGRVEKSHAYIVRTLARRFGTVPAPLQERLEQVTEQDRLDALFDAALSVERIEDFAALLPARV
jgi:flagellar biosynthesis/type III secretory pathway protein FliH